MLRNPRVSQFEKLPVEFDQFIKSEFYRYSGTFRHENDEMYNQHMEVKEVHTSKVYNEIIDLGKWLGMNNEELAFAGVIAWLHDIGRFEQFDKYGTFNDGESVNHAELSVDVTKRLGLLNDLNSGLQEVIIRAILNHNIPRVPANENKTTDFYSRLLRDADKLDIWRLAIEIDIFHKISETKHPDYYEVPDILLDYFKRGDTIYLKDVDSFYDSILFRVSWVYDLNFSHSLGEFGKRNIANRFLAKVPSSDRLKQVETLVDDFVNAGVNNLKTV